MEAGSTGSVGGTLRPRTERGHEPRWTYVLDGVLRPAHDPVEEQGARRTETKECRGFVVR